MGDVFKEQLVKRMPTMQDNLKRGGLVLAALLLCAVVLGIEAVRIVFPVILVVVAFGLYYGFSFFKKEYEYAFTNGELDIDIIYNQSRRKRLFSGSVNDFELLAPAMDKDHDLTAPETKDYSSGIMSANVYAFVTSYKGKRMKILFEPNDMMLQAVSTRISPRKFIRKA